MRVFHLPRSGYPVYLPLVAFVGSLLLGVVTVATGTDTRIRAYNIPFFPLPAVSTPGNSVSSSINSINAMRDTVTPTPSREPTLSPSPATIHITSTAPSQTPVSASQSVSPSADEVLGCRQDCTFTACGEGLACLAIANDDGYYSYQCMNPSCHPNLQTNSCSCPEATKGPLKK